MWPVEGGPALAFLRIATLTAILALALFGLVLEIS